MPVPSGAALGQQLLDVPFPEMIKSMGLAIAEAQFALDEVGIRLAQMMSGTYEVETLDDDGNSQTTTKTAYVKFDGEDLSLLELGFTPSFYQFVDTVIEVKISISMTYQRESSKKTKTKAMAAAVGVFGGGAGFGMASASVNASYASKFQYSAEGSSLLRTKLVPVPPPAVLEERIRRILDREREAEAAKADAEPSTID